MTNPENTLPVEVVNQLYIDLDPIDFSTGKPKNNWKIFSEFIDRDGVSSGNYNRAANWGGWETTVRTDGFQFADFSLLSVREIVPPSR